MLVHQPLLYRSTRHFPPPTHTHYTHSTGDEITEITVIDDGWMEGRVKRTNQYGMLPSNYVEKQ